MRGRAGAGCGPHVGPRVPRVGGPPLGQGPPAKRAQGKLRAQICLFQQLVTLPAYPTTRKGQPAVPLM